MFDSALIGEKIKEIRKKKKLSQEKLAEKISMNQRSIVRLENAHSLPTIDTLEKIAAALDVNINDFFETQTIKSRQQIMEDITKCLESMDNDELKTFYKAVYYFMH